MRFLNRKNNVLIKFIVPYMVILIMTVSAAFVWYNNMIEIIESEIARSNHLSLEQISNTIESDMKEINDMVFRLKNDSKVQTIRFLEDPFTKTNLINVYEAMEQLKSYKIYNDLLIDYSVQYMINEVVLTPESVYKTDTYIETYFEISEDVSQESYNRIFDVQGRGYIPLGTVKMNNIEEELIGYVYNIGRRNDNRILATFYLDNKYIEELFGNIDLSDGGYVYIEDQIGTVISVIQEDGIVGDVELVGDEISAYTNDKGQQMLVTSIVSDQVGWKYVIVQSDRIVKEKVDGIRQAMFITLLIYLLFGIGYSFIIAYRNSRPIQRIFNEATREGISSNTRRSANVYKALDTYFHRILDDNSTLNERLHRQLPILRNSFFEKLLRGNVPSRKQAEALAKHIDFDIDSGYVLAATIHIYPEEEAEGDIGLKELEIQQLYLEDLINQSIKTNKYIHQSEPGGITVCHFLPFMDKEQCLEQLKENYREIINNPYLKGFIGVGIGRLYEDVLDISRSYEEANQALNYLEYNKLGGLKLVSEIEQSNNVYYYPGDMDVKLMNCVASCDKEGLAQIIEKLYTENFINRQLSFNMIQIFVSNVYGGLLKCSEKMSILDDDFMGKVNLLIKNINKNRHKSNLYDYETVVAYYSHLCDVAKEKKCSQNELLVKNVKNYLEENYTDPMLNLGKLADEFNRSETYLSQYFKEHTGENYSECLKKIRMKYATRQLSETKKSISQISDDIGYSTASAFARAFRQYYGVSASTYRKNMNVSTKG